MIKDQEAIHAENVPNQMLDPQTGNFGAVRGQPLWSLFTNNLPYNTSSFNAETFFFIDKGGRLYAVNVLDGSLLRQQDCRGTLRTGIFVREDRVYIAVRLWQVTNGERRYTLGGHTFPVKSVAFSRDGLLLASSGKDGRIILRDVPRWNAIPQLTCTPTGTLTP